MSSRFNIEKIHQDEKLFQLKIQGDISDINHLRRILLTKIPCMAFRRVEILENVSHLDNSQLFLRIHQIPILSEGCEFLSYPNHSKDPKKNQLKEYQYESSEFTIPFRIFQSCLGKPFCDVNSKSFKRDEISEDETKNIFPHPKSFVLTLDQGQKISALCFAQKGVGEWNSIWMTVSLVRFSLIPQIVLSERKLRELPKEEQEEIRKNKTKILQKYQSQTLRFDVTLQSYYVRREDQFELPEYLKFSFSGNKTYLFSFESQGQYSPEKILEIGLEIFDEDVQYGKI